jgi:hypothetical protein
MKRAWTVAAGVLALAAGSVLAAAEYDLTIVEAFQTTYANRTSTLNDISDTGLAIGLATDLTQTFSISAFTWSAATDKTRLPEDVIDRAINSQGVAVGAMRIHFPATGTIQTIPGLNATYGKMRATGINDSNIVVGYAQVTSGSNSNGLSQLAFWWDSAGGTHPVNITDARELLRINNAGEAAGNIRHLDGISEAFAYNVHSGQWTNLGAILPPVAASAPYSIAADIAENGLIAGNLLVFNGETNARTVFTWSPASGFTVQPVLTGPQCDFVAQGVNSAGVVVGYRRTPTNDVSPNTAVVWDAQRGVRDLNTLVDLPAGFTLRRAVKINDNGWIVGHGVFAAQPNLSRAVVLRPRPVLCAADLDNDGGFPGHAPDGAVDVNDLLYFLAAFEVGDSSADLDNDGDPAVGMPDGGVDINDLLFFLARFEGGC